MFICYLMCFYCGKCFNQKEHISIKCPLSCFLCIKPYIVHVFVLITYVYRSLKWFVGEDALRNEALIIGSIEHMKYVHILLEGINVIDVSFIKAL